MLTHKTDRINSNHAQVVIYHGDVQVAVLEQVRAATHRYQRLGTAETFRDIKHAKQVLEERIRTGRLILSS